MAANPERGEVDIVLNGNTHKLRPTFEAMIEIETGTRQKFVPFYRNFAIGEWGVHDLAVIVTAGMHAAGEKEAKIALVGRMLVQAGISSPAVLGPIQQFLLNAMNGGGEPGEAAAAADQT